MTVSRGDLCQYQRWTRRTVLPVSHRFLQQVNTYFVSFSLVPTCTMYNYKLRWDDKLKIELHILHLKCKEYSVTAKGSNKGSLYNTAYIMPFHKPLLTCCKNSVDKRQLVTWFTSNWTCTIYNQVFYFDILLSRQHFIMPHDYMYESLILDQFLKKNTNY